MEFLIQISTYFYGINTFSDSCPNCSSKSPVKQKSQQRDAAEFQDFITLSQDSPFL